MEEQKTGRPTKYKEEYASQAYKLFLLHKETTDKDLCEFFDIAESTLNLWKLKHPEFSEALKRGKLGADTEVAHSLYQRAVGYKHPEEKIFCQDGQIIVHETTKHYPPDTGACAIWLKNRKMNVWRDRHEVKHEVDTIADKSDYDRRMSEVINLAKQLGIELGGQSEATSTSKD